MNKRSFLRSLLGLAAAPFVGRVYANPVATVVPPRAVLIQESPLAGFQYYDGERIWPQLKVGAVLNLLREPANGHDERAVAVYWRDRKLGYVPRDENAAVAQMLDRGQPLSARIVALQEAISPWQRVRFAVNLYAGAST